MNILNFFFNEYNNEDDLLFLHTTINDKDRSLVPIIDIILRKKPKVILYSLTTECMTFWMMPFLKPNRRINEFLILDNLLEYIGAKFYLILGSDNPEYHSPFRNPETKLRNFEILYWPTYLVHHTYINLQNSYIQKRNLDIQVSDLRIETKFDMLYVNYNNKSRYHRCIMIDQLYGNGLFDIGLNSWNLNYQSHLDVNSQNKIHKFIHWNEEYINFDGYGSEDYIDEYTDSIVKNNALISLVTETSMVIPFVTEKTFRPIFLEQPFICLGAKNQNMILQKYGIELYDEIFDYSFDLKNDIQGRVDGIIKNLKSIQNQDYNQIYNNLLPKIKRNKKRLLDLYQNDSEFNPFVPFYEKYNIYK